MDDSRELDERKKNLIVHLKLEGYLKTKQVEEAFWKIPRENFVPDNFRQHAYSDEPLPIGFGQTISAPHMHAVMTELLEPNRTDIVLEIGAGSGYQSALLSHLVRKIYTVEFEPPLAESSRASLKKSGITNVEVIQGDGSKGYPQQAPYDKIIVTCAIPRILPALKKQLKEGGVLVAPVGDTLGIQTLTLAKKVKGKLEIETYFTCVFVPLRTSRQSL